MLYFPVFQTKLFFVNGEKKFDNFCRRYKIPKQEINKNADASTWSFCKPGHPLLVCVVYHPRGINKGVKRRLITCLLAHESMHVVQDMFDEIGEKTPGKETQAYTLQTVLNYLLKEWNKI